MTKVITISKFLITDVNRENSYLRVWYSAPDDPHEQSVDIDADKFYEWLQDSGHLDQQMTIPYGRPEDSTYHEETIPYTLSISDFWHEDNDFTWPIIKSYLEIYHRPDAFSSTATAINSILSHFKHKI